MLNLNDTTAIAAAFDKVNEHGTEAISRLLAKLEGKSKESQIKILVGITKAEDLKSLHLVAIAAIAVILEIRSLTQSVKEEAVERIDLCKAIYGKEIRKTRFASQATFLMNYNHVQLPLMSRTCMMLMHLGYTGRNIKLNNWLQVSSLSKVFKLMQDLWSLEGIKEILYDEDILNQHINKLIKIKM